MNRKLLKILTLLIAIAIITGACGLPTAVQTISKTAEAVADAAQLPSLTSVEPIVNPSTDSPTKITGDFAYSNDFVLETYYVEQAVALADMHGFVTRDKEWITPTESQTLGFMGVDAENNNGTYTINLPILPEGTFNDVDNNGNTDQGVQIFASSYWPNLAGGPYSEGDDPTTGWPNYLASIKTDSENNDEVTAGKLFVWSPDSNQQFPTGFGDDAALFTNDDPVGPIPAGWSMVDLDSNPFSIVRDETLTAELYEPTDLSLKDFSGESYTAAFKKMFDVISREYAFNGIPDKAPAWDAVYAELEPKVKQAEADNDPKAFYLAIQEFTFAFKDGHVGLSGGEIENEIFTQAVSTGYGLSLRLTDTGKVIVVYLTPDGPAEKAGILLGAEITSVNNEPVLEAVSKVEPLSAPFSTDFAKVYQQLRYLTRAPLGTSAEFQFINPGKSSAKAKLVSIDDYSSYSFTSVMRGFDYNALPVEYTILDSGIGYIKINSNYDDLNLVIRIFMRALKIFQDNQLPGIIIDMRQNSGGSPLGLAGFLTDADIPLGQLEYYSDKTGKFEPEGPRDKFTPNVEQFRFDNMALLVGQACASACEIEAYGFSQVPGMLVFGETPSAGVEAEVARGQFSLPEGIFVQVPTGRFTLPDSSIFLEGEGVQPTNLVPATIANLLSGDDYILIAAEEALLQ